MRPSLRRHTSEEHGQSEFTEIIHISTCYVYKRIFLFPSENVCSPLKLMRRCTRISYPAAWTLFSFPPSYASSFADDVLISTQHSTLQWRLYLGKYVLYAITRFVLKKNNCKKIFKKKKIDTQCLYYKGELGARKVAL